MTRLVAENLHFARGRQPILRGVDFTHDRGVLTFLGPSGSGKTTLLWLLAGLLQPDTGRIDFGGTGVKGRLGFVFQDGGLWEHLSTHAHLDIVLRGHSLSRRERAQCVDRALADTGLTHLAARRPGELSGGERQRLALARGLVVEPRRLLLDEPTSQLDGPSRAELIDLLEQRLRTYPAGVILATHQVDLAMRLSDRIAVLQDGRIAQIGAPAEVYDYPTTLAVARLLGPAFELRIGDGVRICRPNHVRFDADPAGPFTVRTCHFAGSSWHVEAVNGVHAALIASDKPIPVGAAGRVSLRDPT